MDMPAPMPPMSAPSPMPGGPGPMPGGQDGPPVEAVIVEALSQARRVAEQAGLDFDSLVEQSRNLPDTSKLPPPPPMPGRGGPMAGPGMPPGMA
jgi:hypothetical protein